MKHFVKRAENFECEFCHTKVMGRGYTDHCPNCLLSKHVDINPGDRLSGCNGIMEPISAVNERTYVMITYKCMKCGAIKRVKAAGNDNRTKLERLMKIKAAHKAV